MAHEVETMAYRFRSTVDTPWHGLGEKVTEATSPEEMAKIAKLDWTVSKRYTFVRQGRQNDGMLQIPNVYSLMRDTDHQYYGTCSARFKIVQNRELIKFFSSYCDAGGMELETLGSLRNGAIVWAMAKMQESFILPGGDKVDGYIVLANAHDGSMQYTGYATSVRVVCMNTLRMSMVDNADGKRLFRIKHNNKNWRNIVEDAKSKVKTAASQMKTFEQIANKLAAKKVSFTAPVVEQFVRELVGKDGVGTVAAPVSSYDTTTGTYGGSGVNVLDSILDQSTDNELIGQMAQEHIGRTGKGILEAIMSAPGQGMESANDTWWGVLNGVTYYYDHVAGRGADTRMQSSMFGVNQGVKVAAAELAMQYAGVEVATAAR